MARATWWRVGLFRRGGRLLSIVAVEKCLLSMVALEKCVLSVVARKKDGGALGEGPAHPALAHGRGLEVRSAEKGKIIAGWIRRRGKWRSQVGKLNLYLFRGRPRSLLDFRPVISCSGDTPCLVRAFSLPFISRSHVHFFP